MAGSARKTYLDPLRVLLNYSLNFKALNIASE